MRKIFIYVSIIALLALPLRAEALSIETQETLHRSAARARERQLRLQDKQDTARPRTTSTTTSLEMRAQQRRILRQNPAKASIPSRRRATTDQRTNRRVLEKRQSDRTSERRTVLANKNAVLKLINEERAYAGLPALTYNRSLEHSAQLHAQDMMYQDYFSHTSLDGREPEDRIRAVGYLDIRFEDCNCRGYKATVGENIAKGQTTVKQVVHEWMESPGHRKNILSGNYKEMGVGIIGNIWAQHFGGIDLQPR
ncbi:MAG: CAP domain-containing protein [bacterium]|nr:CAP domain-containing protein [bacterium]